MNFNFIWTQPYGNIVYNTAPTVRFNRSHIHLNKQALEMLPEDTKYVDIGIDTAARVIAIRKSENTGRKLSKASANDSKTFSCTTFLKAYPEVETKAYSVQCENNMILIRY